MFDCRLSDLLGEQNTAENVSGIPIVRDYRSQSAVASSDVFLISGMAQTYKTTLCLEMINDFDRISPLKGGVFWLDCEFKFPIDRIGGFIDEERVKVMRVTTSEKLLMGLYYIEYLIKQGTPVQTIVVDGVNSFYYIDNAAYNMSDVGSATRISYEIQSVLELMSSSYGIKVIITFHKLGKYSWWSTSSATSVQSLWCETTGPGQGHVTSGAFRDSFKVTNWRMEWTGRTMAPRPEP